MWQFLDRHFEEILGSLLFAVMVGVAFVNVVVRYLTPFSFAWSEELTINFFVWVVLLGTARAFREGTNLGMNLLYDALPRHLRLGFYWLAVLFCLGFFGIMAYVGLVEVLDEIEIDSVSEALAIPVWWYTMATPLFSVLIIFRMLQKTCADMRNRYY